MSTDTWEQEKMFDHSNGVEIPSGTIARWHKKVLEGVIKHDGVCIVNSGNSIVIGRKVHFTHEAEPTIEIFEIPNGYKRFSYKQKSK